MHSAELIASTTTLLRRRGYSGTSVKAFLQAAGAANGSLYHHFPGGKEELAVAAITAVAAQVEGALRSTLDAHEDVVQATQQWVDLLIDALQADPRDGCPVAPSAIDAGASSEPLRLAAAAAFEGWADAFSTALARTRTADVARAQALVLLSAIEGALLLDRTTRDTSHLKALRDAVPSLIASAAW